MLEQAFDFLRNVPLFKGMPDADLQRICEFADLVRLAPGERLFSEGEPGDAAYVIKSGEVEVVKVSSGREVLLAVRKQGDVIGEVALLEEAPRMATVRSARGAEVLAIPRDGFKRLLASSISAVQSLYFTMVERLRGTEIMLRQSEKMAQLGTLSAGVAHELNNPAAAVKRGADQLSQELERYSVAVRELGSVPLAEAGRTALMREVDAARGPSPAVASADALARSDRESEVESWLERRGIERAWEMAPTLAELGYDLVRMDALAGAVGGSALGPALRLIVAARGVQSVLREISEGAARISEIVKALKSYTYLDQAPVQEVDVHEGLESTLVILRSKLKQGVEIRREYDKELPRITAYGAELNQVWTNLIDNAIDAMDGKGTLTLRTRRDGEGVAVEVEDTGHGIPEAIREKVFDPFFTTKPPGKGTGLGLDITYRIVVQRHRGDIGFVSQPGLTSFKVRLPLRPEAGPAPPHAGALRASDEELRAILRDAKTVAVVGISDDPAKPANSVPAYLAAHGYRVIPVNPKLESVLGERAYPDLKSVAGRVDVVQVFRRADAVPPIVEDAIAIGAKVVWMQSGIVNEEAAERARQAGLKVVMDACMRATHLRLFGEAQPSG
jgi:signal transduction histidine kinase/predicted CoA-binding protein